VKGSRGKQPLFLAMFGGLYGLTLLVYTGSQEARYLIPVFILILFYGVRGMQRLGTAASIGACLLLVTGYVLQYRTENFRIINESNGHETFVAMCSWVRNNTTPQDRIIFNKARALSLFTDRSASPYHQPLGKDDLWEYFRSQKISYVVSGSVFDKDRSVLTPVLHIHRSELETAYGNSEFTVYRIQDSTLVKPGLTSR